MARDKRRMKEQTASQEAKPYQIVPDTPAGFDGERATGAGVVLFSLMVGALAFAVVSICGVLVLGRFDLLVSLVALAGAILSMMGIHIAQQWERVVVLRLGKFNRVSGPGLFFTIPLIEQNAIRIDCRMRVTAFGAEETLTADLVPLDVNAIMLWMVYDAKAACTEVSNFSATVELVAQTALRDAIGQLSAAEVALRREQLDADIQQALEDEASQWGISILSVKIRDMIMPEALQDVMSMEAQAEQRRKARIALMEAEQDISAMAEEVGEAYGGGDAALRLRQMHLLYESVRETGGTVVVPSSFSEGFGDVLPDEMKAAARSLKR